MPRRSAGFARPAKALVDFSRECHCFAIVLRQVPVNSHRELQAVDFSDILRLSDTISRGILSAWEKLLKSRKSCLPEGSSFSWL